MWPGEEETQAQRARARVGTILKSAAGRELDARASSAQQYGKRYVPEKEYIHMISSYITADWSNIE